MIRIALAFGALAAACSAASAQAEFEPTPDERKAIAACLELVIGQPELKQMAECIGIVADPCPNAPGANTFTIVVCHMREQKIWDGYLNEWYGEAEKRLADEPAALTALKDAERVWIAFREAKCAIGRSATRAARSLPSSPAIACGSKRGAARSKCARSSTTSITDRRKPV